MAELGASPPPSLPSLYPAHSFLAVLLPSFCPFCSSGSLRWGGVEEETVCSGSLQSSGSCRLSSATVWAGLLLGVSLDRQDSGKL